MVVTRDFENFKIKHVQVLYDVIYEIMFVLTLISLNKLLII